MAFDDKQYHAPAINGDVGGISLTLSLMIDTIMNVLEKLEVATGVDLEGERAILKSMADDAFTDFRDIAGWTEDEDA